MHEGINSYTHEEEAPRATTPESTANKEWRATELTLSRLANPRIKQQLVDIMYQKKIDEYERYRDEEWGPCTLTGMEKGYKQGKNTGVIIAEDALADTLATGEHISKEQVEEEIDKEIKQAASKTDIDFSDSTPRVDVMPLNWKLPGTDERPSTKILSAMEAHEKGHAIRHYDHLDEKWQDAFDLSRLDFTPEDIDKIRKREFIDDENGDLTEVLDDQEAVRFHNEYLFSAVEIAERMNQLKNYFSFAGDEVFTKEHLDYAREHYVEDTGLDNNMTFFFKAITPETEDRFLEIINSSGI